MNEIADLTYHKKNQNVILNKARLKVNKDYYKNNKERSRKQARDKYKSLFAEEKDKNIEYGKSRYHNIPEEKNKD